MCTGECSVLHGDHLGLEVLIERLFAQVLAVAGLLEASKWSRNVCLVVCVYKHCTCLALVSDIQCLVDVTCEDPSR